MQCERRVGTNQQPVPRLDHPDPAMSEICPQRLEDDAHAGVAHAGADPGGVNAVGSKMLLYQPEEISRIQLAGREVLRVGDGVENEIVLLAAAFEETDAIVAMEVDAWLVHDVVAVLDEKILVIDHDLADLDDVGMLEILTDRAGSRYRAQP